MNRSNLVVKNGVLLALLSLTATTTLANETTIANTQNADADSSQTFQPAFTGYVAGTYSDDWASDYRDDRSFSIDLKLGYQFTPNFSAGVITGAYYLDTAYCSTHTKDYWCMSSTSLYAKYNNLYSFFDDFTTIGVQGRVILPTTQYSQDTNLYFGLKGYVPISFDVDRYVDGLSLSLTPSVTKYFNKYKTAGGQNLTEYTLALTLDTTYQISDKFYFTVSLDDYNYITYQGSTTYPTISHTEELGYQATDNIYVGVGYTNSAQYYDPEHGPSPISDLFDDKDPHFYLTTYYSF
ncbi:hypothetical protein VHA01S_018_00770 [Vibrio halioticoli NBRC 102217]|uniref:Outer membrane protein beta-barrel domain-containing protein n=1 Tax=Vibrio halioticoli NBRC 102217 TaxID=1219072 RepID=V5F2C4_9VIBR|nr:hypothetical protein [Vibrio halioticoli]GAD89289.1 hypothetical protein VHA01S_018_00770 [Vibrio halioticoli NBRC 102217]